MTTRSRAVGHPIHETRLTMAALAGARSLLEDREGLAMVPMTEVEVGIGRPDILLAIADPVALTLRRAAGLRLRNLSEAQILEKGSLDEALAATRTRHERRVADSMANRGWFGLADRRPVVVASLLLEAKVTAWHDGLHQLSRVRWAAHGAALVLPSDIAKRVPAASLRRPAVGLVSVSESGEVSWRRRAPVIPVPFHIDAWLGELVLRDLEGR